MQLWASQPRRRMRPVSLSRRRTGASLRAVVLTALQIGLSRRLREGQRIYEALRRHEPSVSGHLALAELCTYHCSLQQSADAGSSEPSGREVRQAGNCRQLRTFSFSWIGSREVVRFSVTFRSNFGASHGS